MNIEVSFHSLNNLNANMITIDPGHRIHASTRSAHHVWLILLPLHLIRYRR